MVTWNPMTKNYTKLKILSNSPSTYRWLSQKFEVYLSPAYYKSILPAYRFNNKSDETLLKNWLEMKLQKGKSKFENVLELGCGSGRGTMILKNYSQNLTAVDLSKQMLSEAKRKIKSKHVKFYNSEMFRFVKSHKAVVKKTNFVLSFWAMNYSLNAEFAYRNPAKKEIMILDERVALKKCTTKLAELFDNLPIGAEFLIFHYDPHSEEQTISHKCWEKILPFPGREKSPSFLALKSFFKKASFLECKIYTIKGVVRFRNLNKALETYMNFHLHTTFNKTQMQDKIIMQLTKDLAKFKNKRSYELRAGVVVIEGKKITTAKVSSYK